MQPALCLPLRCWIVALHEAFFVAVVVLLRWLTSCSKIPGMSCRHWCPASSTCRTWCAAMPSAAEANSCWMMSDPTAQSSIGGIKVRGVRYLDPRLLAMSTMIRPCLAD